MPSSLIRGRYVVTRILDRDRAEVLEDAAVFQRDGVIVEVGPHADLAAGIRRTRCSARPTTSSCPASSTAITTSG